MLSVYVCAHGGRGKDGGGNGGASLDEDAGGMCSCIHMAFNTAQHGRADTDYTDSGMNLGLCPANERRRYKVMPSLIG